MSAKRVKAPRTRKDRLPIPSFTNGNMVENRSPINEDSTSAVIPVRWDKNGILDIDNTLRFAMNRKGEAKYMPLESFYKLVRESRFNLSPSYYDLLSSAPEELKDLSQQERVLYDLICASSPALYKLSRVSTRLLGYTDKPDLEYLWCLEIVPCVSGNRTQELHKLLKQRTVEKLKSEEILRTIRAHRKDMSKSSPVSSSSSSTDVKAKVPVPEALIRSDMTLIERVRARARAYANEKRVQEAQAKSQDKEANLDREWLVRLADALWSHSRDITLCQTRFQSPLCKQKPSNCILTLKDTVTVLSQSLSTRKTSGKMPSHYNQGEKQSKRRIFEAIQDLCALVPEWVQLTPGVSGKYDQESTVWIKPVDYSAVRAKLTGKPLKKASVSLKRPPSETTPGPSATLPSAPPLQKQKNAFTTPVEGTSMLKVVTDDTGSVPPHKKARVNVSLSGMKRSASEEVVSPRSKKKRKALRINTFLILTDADHDGGERIQPSSFDSPRGLKSLFIRMNAGERI